jgi:nascent polypeptide-associated complex subunit alpha
MHIFFGVTMMPGMRGVNPRQVKQAMRKLGIETEDLEDVQDVVIRTKSKQYVITDASVTIMQAQGQKTYQITGETEILPLSQTPASKVEAPAVAIMPEEDIKLVMSQTGASREKVIEALKATDGQPAEAIIKLISS